MSDKCQDVIDSCRQHRDISDTRRNSLEQAPHDPPSSVIDDADAMWPAPGSQRYVRRSKQCGDRFAQAEPQRGSELAGPGQLVELVYYKEFIAEGGITRKVQSM